MSSQSWVTRWENIIERGDIEQLGPKGREYFAEHYGIDFGGGGGGDWVDEDFVDDYEQDYGADGSETSP